MAANTEYRFSTYFLGVASLALSTVGLLLFFMPVLGVPLSSIGLLFAITASWRRSSTAARGPPLGGDGIALGLAALGVNLIIVCSPLDTAHNIASHTPAPAARPYVSPPAQP